MQIMQFAGIRKSETNRKQPSLGLGGIGFKLPHAVEQFL